MTGHPRRGYSWVHDTSSPDLAELCSFAYHGATLARAVRVLADGLDCAYIADVAVHPDHQGHRPGSEIIRRLVAAAQGHEKIILNADPGTEACYGKPGFLRMNTAPAIWNDPARAIGAGLLSAQPPA